jgi:long-subunit acyl-CoA synthetase (AMP-forming)
VLTFLKSAFSCALHEGYGQTEGLILTVTDRDDAMGAGTVGGPCPNTKFRLRDIPEMNYLSTD